ncbi:Germin-like protein 8-2 [Acorus gramineus]|uniref:Germin-like protein 8-2 n=1 Tax=Acorus gramineus TaxID=55184 RepID=A0AAV9BRJ9_ACOGR|nr:Germin-like protein 8-2 [Acorus gramineus]
MASALFIAVLLTLASSGALASDPGPLQDFCVADNASAVLVNGFICKNPMKVDVNDFFFSGLNKPGNTNNRVGSNVTTVNVNQIGGLNTLGISLVRIDYAPYGQNPPHTHPRATEILTVIEGTLHVGFVTSNPQNRLIFQSPQRGIANAVFGSNPKIDDGVLAKAFQVDKKVIDYLQSQFWEDNNN